MFGSGRRLAPHRAKQRGRAQGAVRSWLLNSKSKIGMSVYLHLTVVISCAFLCLRGNPTVAGQEVGIEEIREQDTPLGLTVRAIESMKRYRLFASGDLAKAVGETGDYKTALLVIRNYQDEVHWDNSQRNLAGQLVESRTIPQSIEICERLNDDVFENYVVRQLLAKGDSANDHLHELTKLTISLSPNPDRDRLLGNVARRSVTQKQFPQAKATAQKIENPEWRQKLFNQIHFEQALSESRFKEAEKLVAVLYANEKQEAIRKLSQALNTKLTPEQQRKFVEESDLPELKIPTAALTLTNAFKEKDWEGVRTALSQLPNQELGYFLLGTHFRDNELSLEADDFVQLATIFDAKRLNSQFLDAAAMLKAGEGHLDEALGLLDDDFAIESRPKLLREYIKWAVQSKLQEKAFRAISEYEELGNTIDGQPRNAHFGNLISDLAKLGEYQLAMDLADRSQAASPQTLERIVKFAFDQGNETELLEQISMTDVRIRSVVLSFSAIEFAAKGKEKEAVDVGRSISTDKGQYSRLVTLSRVSNELIRKEQHLLQHGRNRIGPRYADSVAPSVERIPLIWATLQSISETSSATEKKIDLLLVIDQSKNRSIRDEVLASISNELASLPKSIGRDGHVMKFANALATLELTEAQLELADAVENRHLRERILDSLEMAEKTESKRTPEVAKERRPIRAAMSDSSRFRIIQSWIQEGRIDEALEEIEVVKTAHMRDRLYTAAFRKLSMSQQREQAEAVSALVEDARLRDEFNREVVREFLKEERFDKAIEKLQQMETIEFRDSTLYWIVKELCCEEVRSGDSGQTRFRVKPTFSTEEARVARQIDAWLNQ